MNVSDLGEFGLIERLTGVFDANYRPPKSRAGSRADGPFDLLVDNGDDAAAWAGPAGTTVLTCDAMVAGTHFDLAYAEPGDVGWRAMVSCQSDVAAMGFQPAFSTVTLGLTGDEPAALLDDLYVGMAQACSHFGGRVVGGDVVRSETMFISVAMVGGPPPGERDETSPMTRSAAKPGDVIAITGPVGGSAGGLRLLMSGANTDTARGVTEATLTHAHLRPEPRVTTGIWLAANGVACAVDVSDGLVDDLGRVCRASDVAARVRLSEIPVDPALKQVFPDDWPELVLGGGEGYHLLFTAPAEVVEASQTADPSIRAIGEITDGPPQVTVLDDTGTPIETGVAGFDHFI
jgi:thiamine-monophosphate kinase